MGRKIALGLMAGLVAAAIGGFAAPAQADGMDKKKGSMKDAPAEEPKRDLQITGNAGVASEYVFRGFSQSAENPAVFAGVDVTYKWFYAGLWASTIDFGKDGNFPTFDVAHGEVDYYLGVKPVLGKVTFDLRVIQFTTSSAL